MIFESSVKTQVLLFATPEQHKEAASYYEDVAAKYRGEYIFVSVILDGDENSIGVAEYFGVLPESDQEAEEEESLEDADTAEAKANALLDDFKPVAFIFFAPDEIDPVEKSAEEEEDPVETTDQRPKKWKLEEELSQASSRSSSSLTKLVLSRSSSSGRRFLRSRKDRSPLSLETTWMTSSWIPLRTCSSRCTPPGANTAKPWSPSTRSWLVVSPSWTP